jgi:DNA (cytosine-5)-methyltransferase 1
MITCIDYFAGIGAWELAAEILEQIYGYQVFTTYQFVEILPSAQQVLRSHYPLIPIHSDIKTYTPPQNINVYFISFPCTGTSQAGTKTGLNHPDSNLWFEALRCICIGKPKFVVIEQPEGFIHRGLRACLGGLRMAGYSTEVEIISASQLGAPHLRKRVFVIAYANTLAIESKKGWCCWSEQIGMDIEKTRQITRYSQNKSSSVSMDARFPPWLDGINFDGWWLNNSPPTSVGIKPRTRCRRECINLYGGSIAPLQAICILIRLKFLCSLLSK